MPLRKNHGNNEFSVNSQLEIFAFGKSLQISATQKLLLNPNVQKSER
jgi:hypothetical protein